MAITISGFAARAFGFESDVPAASHMLGTSIRVDSATYVGAGVSVVAAAMLMLMVMLLPAPEPSVAKTLKLGCLTVFVHDITMAFVEDGVLLGPSRFDMRYLGKYPPWHETPRNHMY